jgi:hypothetical protein
MEEAITRIFDEFTFDNVQSVFQNRMSRLGWVIENGGIMLTNKRESECLCCIMY